MPILAILSLIAVTSFTSSYGANFNIVNQCTYTVWAAAAPVGGQRLDPGQSWSLTVVPGTNPGRIWGRTNCNFDANGQGQCDSGNCNGGIICQGYGTPPNTLVEFALNQFDKLDFMDVSLVGGYNLPIDFSPTTNACKGIRCSADVNSQCPTELKAPGGCNNPCMVFKTNEYCCNDGSCGPTTYSKFFKYLCPDAYSYPKDDATSTFTCPSGTNYKVTFCP